MCVCMSVLYDTAMIICKGGVKTVMGVHYIWHSNDNM